MLKPNGSTSISVEVKGNRDKPSNKEREREQGCRWNKGDTGASLLGLRFLGAGGKSVWTAGGCAVFSRNEKCPKNNLDRKKTHSLHGLIDHSFAGSGDTSMTSLGSLNSEYY